MKKRKIPMKVRQEVWIRCNGRVFSSKCNIAWCTTMCTCMSSEWHVGHNIPESMGGTDALDNLVPICASCNLGMGNNLSIDEWEQTYTNKSVDVLSAARALLRLKRGTRKRKREDD